MIALLKTWLIRFLHKSIYKPGHFYSTVPSQSDIDRRKSLKVSNEVSAVTLSINEQEVLLKEFVSYRDKFIWKTERTSGLRYYTGNNYFTQFDGYVLFSMMMKFKPKRVIEVGSGFSSALMLDVNDKYLDHAIDFTFIDPSMDRLHQLLNDKDATATRVRKMPIMIQDVDLSIFESLEEGDILFIDSSHISKVASDVNFEVFEILPRLKSGVIVHFHDICFPFEYPSTWLDQGIFWNEAYLLRAFLMYNKDFSVLMYNNYWKDKELQNFGKVIEGGSLWLKKN